MCICRSVFLTYNWGHWEGEGDTTILAIWSTLGYGMNPSPRNRYYMAGWDDEMGIEEGRKQTKEGGKTRLL